MSDPWCEAHLSKHPRARWTQLEAGSRGTHPLDLMLLDGDRLILLSRERPEEELWSFDDFESVKITEDVGERYALSFESVDHQRPGPSLQLGSSLAFIVFFGTARRRKLRCTFAFTEARLREAKARVSDNTETPVLRWVICGIFTFLLICGVMGPF